MPKAPLRIHALLVLLPLLLCGAAWAHATIVFGTVTPEPNPPQPNEPLALHLKLVDPASVPVEDAFVLAEFSLEGELMGSVRFEQTEPAGDYLAELELPQPGNYLVALRDQTYRQEEAVAELQLELGASVPVEPIDFIFPPTAIGGSLTTWLIWLIGVPIIAGLVVTMLVLRSGAAEGAAPKERE